MAACNIERGRVRWRTMRGTDSGACTGARRRLGVCGGGGVTGT